ncbi:hypothetical protein Acr_00g0100540 [Actinidia rufa]|uniref:Uncharacterized protein n=1 Tax=Actinidia rufa TaxID=165716 RepID=A0A7J0E1K9_9ERIC|nr:hypothetical protein Acr_00g0100540 [Actinidia rufa]
MDLKKLAPLAKAKGEPKKGVTLTGEKGIHIVEKRAQEKALDIFLVKKKGPLPSLDDKKKGLATKALLFGERTSINPGVVLGLEAPTLDNSVMVVKDLEGRVAKLEIEKQHADELRKFKEEHDIAMKKHEKKMAKMRRREAFTKTSAIDEFKALDDYKEVVEEAASSYFGEGFDLCKK